MRFIDSHCHLDHEKFAGDLDGVLKRAEDTGIHRILCIGTGDGPPELDRAIRLAERHEQIVATVGVHPHEAAKVTPETYDELLRLGQHPKVVAYGEIGLDFHYDHSPRDTQREVFILQLDIARTLNLPIVIHIREAWEESMAILAEHWSGPGILHCFTGTPEQATQALEQGFHLAFGGVLTFKTGESVREAARITPEDRLLIETDAPFLAPVPYRGKRNEPAMMMETLKTLAEVRQTTPEHIAELTAANFERLCLQPRNPTRYTEKFHGN
ncbi:MAG TPA: TatD family hydrolase [Bryobacteraceae bacterium]|nr:TatD family hydrolase [Bryobacteraceae bacterium]